MFMPRKFTKGSHDRGAWPWRRCASTSFLQVCWSASARSGSPRSVAP